MDEELIRRLQNYLADQLGAADIARSLADSLSEVALTWKETSQLSQGPI